MLQRSVYRCCRLVLSTLVFFLKVCLRASTSHIQFLPVICQICICIVGIVLFGNMSCLIFFFLKEAPISYVLFQLPSDLFHVRNMSHFYQRHLPVVLSMLEPPCSRLITGLRGCFNRAPCLVRSVLWLALVQTSSAPTLYHIAFSIVVY